MTVSAADALKAMYTQAQAMGDKLIVSDATLEISGYEGLYILTKQFPWPVLGPGGDIEVPGPLGMVSKQPQQVKTFFEGSCIFMETASFPIQGFLEDIVKNKGGRWNAWAYEGTPQAYRRRIQLLDCFFVPEGTADRNMEDRSTILLINGTLQGHYFGTREPGNI